MIVKLKIVGLEFFYKLPLTEKFIRSARGTKKWRK
jgi:hypothetical protein